MIFDLRHPPGPGVIHVTPLTGAAEFAVAGHGAADAIKLIDACLVAHEGSAIGPGDAAKMTVSDRDRLMAVLHRENYGSRISGTSSCHACEERFDFDFNLDDLVGAVEPQATTSDDGAWFREGKTRFRLPTGEDELAAAGRPSSEAAELIALRCVPDATAEARASVEARLAEIAPTVDLSLNAGCPECGATNPMTFNAERYFLSTLAGERHRLMREVHLLAATYHWPLTDVLGLTRSDRRALCTQIAKDSEARRKAGAA